jgi:hypothetical protein
VKHSDYCKVSGSTIMHEAIMSTYVHILPF